LVEHCAIRPRYRRWVQRNLAVLAHNGYLHEQQGVFTSEQPLPVIALAELRDTYQKATSTQTDPALHDLGWNDPLPLLPLQRGGNLKAVLTEDVHSAQIYVSSEMRELYRLLHASNTLCQMVLEEVLRLAPQEKKIRILEIGAGFGITTAYLLPSLPADLTEYVYTDISAYFLQEAGAKFASYPNVSYGLLDIEQNPRAQGYDWHDFDIIIASNVLHATARIAETLKHIRSLLKSHGLLLLLEATRFSPLLDLTMGLQQGMDRFEDTELRPSHPLLTRYLWRKVLKEAGFTASVILNRPGTLTDFFGFDVMLAQAPEEVSSLRLRDLYERLRNQLPEYMLPWRIIPLDALPLTANGKVDRQALPHPLMRSQAQMRSESVAQTPIEQRLVQLWRELLGLGHVGRKENFLELGGDSLLATKLLSDVQATFNVEVPFRVLFNNPTIAALAEAIEQGQELGHRQGQAVVPTTVEMGEEEEGVL